MNGLPATPRPRIAIPLPHSLDLAYSERAIPQYERAIAAAGGEPVRIPLDKTQSEIAAMIQSCDGILLPGSNADVDPARFGAPRSPHTAPADPRRDAVDNLLLEDAYDRRKPILGICYGLQSLNVFRAGSLIQHIPDFLPEDLRTRVDHEAGKNVPVAHEVEIEEDSKLARILCRDTRPRLSNRAQLDVHDGDAQKGKAREAQAREGQRDFSSQPALSKRGAAKGAGQTSNMNRASAPEEKLAIPVNSSHHQSAGTIGSGLRISARCSADGIIEALEGAAEDHFVLAVQWHPERSIDADEPSRAIFRALIDAAMK